MHSCADKVDYSLLIPASLRVDGNVPCVGDRRAVWRKLARVCQFKAPLFHAEAVGAQATCRSKNKTIIWSNSLLLCVFRSDHVFGTWYLGLFRKLLFSKDRLGVKIYAGSLCLDILVGPNRSQ